MYFLFIRIRFTTVTYWQYAYLISVTCFYRFILLKSKKNFLVCARVADMSGRRTRYLLLPAILLRPLSNCQSSVAEFAKCRMHCLTMLFQRRPSIRLITSLKTFLFQWSFCGYHFNGPWSSLICIGHYTKSLTDWLTEIDWSVDQSSDCLKKKLYFSYQSETICRQTSDIRTYSCIRQSLKMFLFGHCDLNMVWIPLPSPPF